MQIKITVRCYLTPLMAIIKKKKKKPQMAHFGEDVGNLFTAADGNVNLCNICGKQYGYTVSQKN